MNVCALPAVPEDPSPRPRGRPRKTLAGRDDGNRRRELIDGAARLFRQNGFAATSTRDIAAAAGMRSGSPFYHFKSKGDLLHAVMEEGMCAAIDRQKQALNAVAALPRDPRRDLAVLIRHHFDVLLGPGSDFIPVMLYEARSLTDEQRAGMALLQEQYEAAWTPVLALLHARGLLRADVKLARLLMLGALNWSAQWYRPGGGASLDGLTAAALALFIAKDGPSNTV